MPETKTRTRKDTPSDKQVETDEAKARAAAKKAEQAAAKAEKDAAKEAEKAEKAAAREHAREAKAVAAAEAKEAREAAKAEKDQLKVEERNQLIGEGKLIEADGVDYVETQEFKKDLVATRAAGVIDYLKSNGRQVPVMGKTLVDEFGGGTVQWVSFMGILRAQGHIRVYRSRSGERGGSGQAYLWISD